MENRKWKVSPDKTINGNFMIMPEDSGMQVARVHNEKDAQLIAAAPDMYEALKELLADTDKTGYTSVPHIIKAAEALAKAEGKS